MVQDAQQVQGIGILLFLREYRLIQRQRRCGQTASAVHFDRGG